MKHSKHKPQQLATSQGVSKDTLIEEMVLGALLLDSGAYDECVHLLSPMLFTEHANILIYAAITEIKAKNLDIDIVSLISQLRATNTLEEIGGAKVAVSYTSKINSSAHVKTHIRMLQDFAMRREIQSFATKAMAEINIVDITSLRDELNQRIDDIINRYSVANVQKFDKIASQVLEDLNDLTPKPKRPFGIKSIDEFTGGMREKELIILAARPAMGKTAKALNTAKANAIAGFPTLFISLEMDAQSLVKRIVSMDAKVYGSVIRDKKYTQDEYGRIFNGIAKINDIPLYVSDLPIRLTELRAFIKNAVQQYGIKTVFLDYIQLVDETGSNHGNREQFIASVSRTLKLCCMEFNLAIVALSQLSRNCEARADKRPLLSDLRESGAIEQDADMVIFLYRDEYYNVMQNANGESTANKAEFIIAKFRNGQVGNTEIGFDSQYTLFYQLDDYSALPDVFPAREQSLRPRFEKLENDLPF